MRFKKRVALAGVGLALLLVAIAVASFGEFSLERSTPDAMSGSTGRSPGHINALPSLPQAAGFTRNGMVQTEDGSWVPGGFYEDSPRSPQRQSVTAVENGHVPAPRESERVGGSFIVDLAPDVDPQESAQQIAADYGGQAEFIYDEVIGGFAFLGPDDARERLANDPRVSAVEPDYEAHLAGHSVPLERTAIRAPEAWSVSQGAGAVVAVIDTGVNTSNPHLSGRVLGKDGSCAGESGSNTGNDVLGHGTAVSGHVFGHYGVLPEAAGYMVKVVPDGSTTTTYSRLICGINLVKSWVSTRTIHAANVSLSGTAFSASLQTAVKQLREAGVVVVGAAGNTGGSVEYPAAFTEAVAVSAMNQSNSALASLSSRGSEIDLGAPGLSLTTLTKSGCCASGSGTSFAAPQVAAAAALVRSRNPEATVDEVISALQKTGFCPPGATADANPDGGDCNGSARDGDSDGHPEPALNLDGAARASIQPAASDAGSLGYWLMDGGSVISSSYFTPSQVPDTNWKIVAVGDINGDGKTDLIWHHQTTGDIGYWLMDGGSVISSSYFTPSQVPDTNWKIVAVGDINGDGKTDLIWHHG